jgi:hypothetical protein
VQNEPVSSIDSCIAIALQELQILVVVKVLETDNFVVAEVYSF